jgi:hypothetical protein
VVFKGLLHRIKEINYEKVRCISYNHDVFFSLFYLKVNILYKAQIFVLPIANVKEKNKNILVS